VASAQFHSARARSTGSIVDACSRFKWATSLSTPCSTKRTFRDTNFRPPICWKTQRPFNSHCDSTAPKKSSSPVLSALLVESHPEVVNHQRDSCNVWANCSRTSPTSVHTNATTLAKSSTDAVKNRKPFTSNRRKLASSTAATALWKFSVQLVKTEVGNCWLEPTFDCCVVTSCRN